MLGTMATQCTQLRTLLFPLLTISNKYHVQINTSRAEQRAESPLASCDFDQYLRACYVMLHDKDWLPRWLCLAEFAAAVLLTGATPGC